MKGIMNPSTCAAALAGLALISWPAFGQEAEELNTGDELPSAQQTQAPLPATPGFSGSYQFKTDMDGGGEFALARLRAGVGVPVRLNDSIVLANRFNYELSHYDFSGAGAASPWETIHTFSAASLARWHKEDHWSVYGGPFLRLAAESGANFGNAFGGGLAGFNYKANDTLTIGGGLAIATQIEDDPIVLPLVTANWKFAENWQLKAGFLDVATLGYGASVA